MSAKLAKIPGVLAAALFQSLGGGWWNRSAQAFLWGTTCV
jgi:hypothetical protein